MSDNTRHAGFEMCEEATVAEVAERFEKGQLRPDQKVLVLLETRDMSRVSRVRRQRLTVEDGRPTWVPAR